MEARAAAIKEQARAAFQECKAKFPEVVAATTVANAQCLNGVVVIARPLWGNPDLLDAFMATRIAVAERVQKGQVTVAQGNEEVANKWTQVVAENQRRSLAPQRVSLRDGSNTRST